MRRVGRVPVILAPEDRLDCVLLRVVVAQLLEAGVPAHLVGGADRAAERDAKRAIRQATELAAAL